jgi:hypothetical protein
MRDNEGTFDSCFVQDLGGFQRVFTGILGRSFLPLDWNAEYLTQAAGHDSCAWFRQMRELPGRDEDREVLGSVKSRCPGKPFQRKGARFGAFGGGLERTTQNNNGR